MANRGTTVKKPLHILTFVTPPKTPPHKKSLTRTLGTKKQETPAQFSNNLGGTKNRVFLLPYIPLTTKAEKQKQKTKQKQKADCRIGDLNPE